VALKKAQEEVIEKCRITHQDKAALQSKFEEEKEKIQREKEKFLTEQVGVKQVVSKSLRSVVGLEKK
jgi:hypothetical protein